jgi:uncharacterized protein (TIGR02391 family)
MLHWRHLHENIRDRIRAYYELGQFGHAAREGVLIYIEHLQQLTGSADDGRALVNRIFNYNPPVLPKVQITALTTDSETNIQEGHAHFSRGLVTGFRNPIQHHPIDTTVPGMFTELDCLNILSLVSYLFGKLDDATVNA